MAKKRIYRIRFHNQGEVYEIYVRSVGSSAIPGFVEVAEFSFGEKSALLVNPGEEGLKTEFAGVKRSHIPMHNIIRIDEVEKPGQAKISDNRGNITPFPMPGYDHGGNSGAAD